MIAEYFEQRGYAIDHAADGITGLHLAVSNPYDVIIADVMLAGMDGITICRKLREEARSDTPLLMLTARDTIDDKLAGLDAGADDYLVKPFAFEELVARVDALGRRAREGGHPVTRVGGLRIDTVARTVHRGEREIVLSRREYQLLCCLASRAGELVSRTEIEDRLYGEDDFPASNVVAVTVSGLRGKLAQAGAEGLIETRRGLGYRFGAAP